MKRSTEHVLTTHTGSLPRRSGLLEGITWAKLGAMAERARIASSSPW